MKPQEMALHVADCILDDLDKTETAVMPHVLKISKAGRKCGVAHFMS